MAVPPAWPLKRLKWSTTGVTGGVWGDEPNGVDDIPCARVADFDRVKLLVSGQLLTLRAIAERERANRLLRQGDLLIEKSGGGDNQPVGCVVSYDGDGEAVCSNFIGRMRPAPNMHSRFWAYVHAWVYSTRQNVVAIKQTTGIQNLDIEAYLDIRVPYPTTEEQVSIASFLDRETARIDALVAAKLRLIDLLVEKRKAIINTAVTRGLDPKAKLRDSGVPWLGEIPAHWNVARLKFSLNGITQGWSPQCEAIPAGPDDWGVLKVGCVNGDAFDAGENKRLPDHETAPPELEIRPRDVLMSRANTTELVGRAALVPGNVRHRLLLCDKLYRLDLKTEELMPEFLVHFLRMPSGRFDFERASTGASNSMQNITQELVRNLWLPVPPMNEQRTIVEQITHETAKLDTVRAATKRTIALLKERRAALIAAAVTGQLEVEGSAA